MRRLPPSSASRSSSARTPWKASRKGGRAELAAKEKTEIELLNTYLPQALSVDELTRFIDEAIAETGATGKAQMSAVMKALQPKVAGRADGRTLSQEVQKRLA